MLVYTVLVGLVSLLLIIWNFLIYQNFIDEPVANFVAFAYWVKGIHILRSGLKEGYGKIIPWKVKFAEMKIFIKGLFHRHFILRLKGFIYLSFLNAFLWTKTL